MSQDERTAAAGGMPDEHGPWGEPSSLRVYSRDEIRSIDRLAWERYGIPTIVLMENAAREVARAAKGMLAQVDRRRGGVLIVCGGGNNGGDGLAAARHLASEGRSVVVLLCADELRVTGDAATNLEIVRRMGIALRVWDERDVAASCDRAAAEVEGGVDLVIDALLGTGLDRAVRGPMCEAIEWMNRLGGVTIAEKTAARRVRILAVDIPSGMDSETGDGIEGGPVVHADKTVTMIGLKRGFIEPSADRYTGVISVADLGIPEALRVSMGVATGW